MPTKKELYAKAKEFGVKGISRMTKHELEEAVIICCANEWFNDIAGNKIAIHDVSNVEFEVDVLDVSGINTD
jgi:hypothetical protein